MSIHRYSRFEALYFHSDIYMYIYIYILGLQKRDLHIANRAHRQKKPPRTFAYVYIIKYSSRKYTGSYSC